MLLRKRLCPKSARSFQFRRRDSLLLSYLFRLFEVCRYSALPWQNYNWISDSTSVEHLGSTLCPILPREITPRTLQPSDKTFNYNTDFPWKNKLLNSAKENKYHTNLRHWKSVSRLLNQMLRTHWTSNFFPNLIIRHDSCGLKIELLVEYFILICRFLTHFLVKFSGKFIIIDRAFLNRPNKAF